MKLKELITAYHAFMREDNRLAELPETEDHGHPFTICTTGARWLKKHFFPNAVVTGYSIDDNPTAKIGEDIYGHDFLIVDGKYLVDFWYRFVTRQERTAPIVLDLKKDKKLIEKYYGDSSKWETLIDISEECFNQLMFQ